MSVEVNWPGSRIEQEPQYRLVTDEQIAKWNSKDSGYVELTGDTLDFDTLPTGKWKYVMKYDSDGNMINPVKSSIANTTQDNFLTKYGNIKFILIDTTINDENIPESWIQIFTHNNSNFNYETGSSSESYHFYRVFKSYEKYDLGDIGTVITQTINDNIAASNIEAEILYLKDNDSSGDEVVTTRMFNSTDEISVENESGDSITNIYNYFHLTYAGYDKNESDSRVYHNVIGTFNLKKDTLEYTTNETFGSDTFKFVINSNESTINTDKLSITGSKGKNIEFNQIDYSVLLNKSLYITSCDTYATIQHAREMTISGTSRQFKYADFEIVFDNGNSTTGLKQLAIGSNIDTRNYEFKDDGINVLLLKNYNDGSTPSLEYRVRSSNDSYGYRFILQPSTSISGIGPGIMFAYGTSTDSSTPIAAFSYSDKRVFLTSDIWFSGMNNTGNIYGPYGLTKPHQISFNGRNTGNNQISVYANGLYLDTPYMYLGQKTEYKINIDDPSISLEYTGTNAQKITANLAGQCAITSDNPLHLTTNGGFAFFDSNNSTGPIFYCTGLHNSTDTTLQFSAGFNGTSHSEIIYDKTEKSLIFREYTGMAPLVINIYNSGKHQTFSTCFPEGNSVYSFIGYDPNASQNTPFNTGLYSLYVDDYIYAKKGLYAYLTIDLNGQIYKYSGKMGDQNYVTITPDSVGAAPANHTHTISEISGVTPEAVGAVSDTSTITDWNTAIKAGYYNSDFGASNTPNPDDTTVTSYGGHVVVGKYFIEQTVFTDAVKDDSGVISRPDSIYQFIRYGKVIISDGNTTYDWGEWYAIQYILPNA